MKFKNTRYINGWSGSSQTVPRIDGLIPGKGYLIHSRHAGNFRSGLLNLAYLPWSNHLIRIDIDYQGDGANGTYQGLQYVVPRYSTLLGNEAGYWTCYITEIDIVEKEE